MNMRKAARPLLSALLMGGIFAAYSFAVQLATPGRIVAGSLVLGAVAAVITYRQERGKPMLPTAALVALGVGCLALYTWALLAHELPSGTEWIAVAIVFAFPVAILYFAYRQWATGSQA